MRWIILLLVLACGCLTQPTIKEKFVCNDGWIADSAGGCSGHTLGCPNCTCQKCECPVCKCPECKTAAAKPLASKAVTESDDSCVRLGCPEGTTYVSSKTSSKYHTCECQFAKRLSAKNRLCYKNAQEAESDGKQPCGICGAKV